MTIAPADDRLRTRIDGVVALPGDPDYAQCAPWNLAAAIEPGMVVFVRSAHDVAETVRYAASVGMTVAVAGTGHGALTVGPETILVHTREMATVTVDPDARVACVGAGAVWQQVLDAATPFGLAPICGSAPGVGVVGYLTGGGIGPLVRSVGVSSDYVLAFELVTGSGDILRVTPEQHGDLFWGLRGGKATLGIVTAVELELPTIPEFYGGALYFDGSSASDVLHAWRRWTVGLPDSVSTSVAFLQLPPLPEVPEPLAGRFTVAVRYVCLGDAGEQLLAPMRAAAPVLLDAVSVLPYAAVGAVHADPVAPMPVFEDHTLLRRLPAAAVEALVAAAGPSAGSPQTIVELRLLGGAFARPARHRSAFCHRDAAYTLTTIGVAEEATPHGASVMAALAPWSTGRQLPNFAPAMGAERLARCYDEDTLFQLAALAERYDPAGVFRVGQVARL